MATFWQLLQNCCSWTVYWCTLSIPTYRSACFPEPALFKCVSLHCNLESNVCEGDWISLPIVSVLNFSFSLLSPICSDPLPVSIYCMIGLLLLGCRNTWYSKEITPSCYLLQFFPVCYLFFEYIHGIFFFFFAMHKNIYFCSKIYQVSSMALRIWGFIWQGTHHFNIIPTVFFCFNLKYI